MSENNNQLKLDWDQYFDRIEKAMVETELQPLIIARRRLFLVSFALFAIHALTGGLVAEITLMGVSIKALNMANFYVILNVAAIWQLFTCLYWSYADIKHERALFFVLNNAYNDYRSQWVLLKEANERMLKNIGELNNVEEFKVDEGDAFSKFRDQFHEQERIVSRFFVFLPNMAKGFFAILFYLASSEYAVIVECEEVINVCQIVEATIFTDVWEAINPMNDEKFIQQ